VGGPLARQEACCITDFIRQKTLPDVGMGCFATSDTYGARDLESFVCLLRQADEPGVSLFDMAGAHSPDEERLGRGPSR
jgi:hypothetical protein